MESLTIPDMDDETLRSLQQRAVREGRSVEQEAVALIRRGLAEDRSNREALVAESRRIRAMTPKGVVQTDSALLLREDRDR